MADLGKAAAAHAERKRREREASEASAPNRAKEQAHCDFPVWRALIKEEIQHKHSLFTSVSAHVDSDDSYPGFFGRRPYKIVVQCLADAVFREHYVKELEALLGPPFRVIASGYETRSGVITSELPYPHDELDSPRVSVHW